MKLKDIKVGDDEFYIHTARGLKIIKFADKERFMHWLLEQLKHGSRTEVLHWIKLPRKHGHDYPEFKTIEKSIGKAK